MHLQRSNVHQFGYQRTTCTEYDSCYLVHISNCCFGAGIFSHKMTAICQTHPCLNEHVWKQQRNTTSKSALLNLPTDKWIFRCGTNITTSAPNRTTEFLLKALYLSKNRNNNVIHFSARLHIFQWHYCNIRHLKASLELAYCCCSYFVSQHHNTWAFISCLNILIITGTPTATVLTKDHEPVSGKSKHHQ